MKERIKEIQRAEFTVQQAELKGKIIIAGLLMGMTLGTVFNPIRINATSLDNVVYEQQETVDDSGAVSEPALVEENNSTEENNDFIKELRGATNLSEPTTTGKSINKFTSTIASFIVQILSYFIPAFLVVRVVGDICYITLPFTRAFLANGYSGNGQAGGAGMGGMGMGMQGGMGGMGMGGMSGGYGMGGYGMNRGYGMGGMGMGGMQGGMGGMQQPGASSAAGRTQWVSGAALNAVAADSMMGQDGKAVSPLKAYAKDMTIVLIITPVLLTLAITGALTQLGFLIGDVISRAVASIGNMM